MGKEADACIWYLYNFDSSFHYLHTIVDDTHWLCVTMTDHTCWTRSFIRRLFRLFISFDDRCCSPISCLQLILDIECQEPDNFQEIGSLQVAMIGSLFYSYKVLIHLLCTTWSCDVNALGISKRELTISKFGTCHITIDTKIENILRKNQTGVRRNRFPTSQILTICRTLEGVRARNLEATIVCVDFAKAFDSIHRGKMEQILLAYGLPKETVATIMMLYRNTKVKVRSPDEDTDDFNIVAGVLPEDTLAPYLFIFCLATCL